MKPTLRKFIHIMLSVLMLCLVFLPACSSGKPTKIKANTGNVISAKTADARLHTTDVTALKKVASSGLLEALHIDESPLLSPSRRRPTARCGSRCPQKAIPMPAF